MKNLNGDILDIRDRENSHMDRKDGKSDYGKQKANEIGKGDRKGKN